MASGQRRESAIAVTLHESHVAWATYEGAVTAVHVVVPDAVDDPHRPSGGNTYDRRVCSGLAALGWSVPSTPPRATGPMPTRRRWKP